MSLANKIQFFFFNPSATLREAPMETKKKQPKDDHTYIHPQILKKKQFTFLDL